ncbi:ferrichrome outer membrane transporter [compost metagenome]
MANLWVSYRLVKGPVKGLGLGIGGNYASENLVINNAYEGEFILPAYTVLNATAFYDLTKFRIGVKLDNLTNERYWIGYSNISPQKSRSISASLAFKF